MELETVCIVGQLVTEITITRSRLAGDDGDALCKHGKREFLLQVEDPFFFQLTDNLLSFASHIPHRELRIDVTDNPRETVCLMKLRIYLQHHVHPCMQRLSRETFEMRTQQLPRISPAACRSLCHQLFCRRHLHQFHVAMSAAFAHLSQLCLYPILIGHRQFQGFAYQGIQFV